MASLYQFYFSYKYWICAIDISDKTIYESPHLQPVKELKGYERISFEPGETKTVKLTLTPEDLSLFDRNMNFVVEPGTFRVMIGSSSQDIRLKGQFEVKNERI